MKRNKKILLVEDEAGFRHIYRDMLSREGYEVLEADNGDRGWELVQQVKPDLILLDIIMPGLGGAEVLKRIRADETTKDIPVIIFSVIGDDSAMRKGLVLGADDYAVKGSQSPNEIVNKIRVLLTKADIQKKNKEQAAGLPKKNPGPGI